MNDNDVLDRLSQSFSGIHMHTPVEEILARGLRPTAPTRVGNGGGGGGGPGADRRPVGGHRLGRIAAVRQPGDAAARRVHGRERPERLERLDPAQG